MPELKDLSHDKRLRNHFNIDKKRRTNRHKQNAPHFHSYYELYYLEEGSSRFFLTEQVYRIHKGDLLIIAPGDYHMCSYDEPGVHDRYALYFDKEKIDPDLWHYLSYFPTIPGRAAHLHIKEAERTGFEALLSRMLTLYRLETPYAEKMLDYLLPCLLLFLAKNTEEPQSHYDDAYARLASASHYIGEHFMEEITLEQVASIAGFTPTYFSRKFKELAGIGFRDYLTHIRLREAERLLKSTKLSVQEISLRCGFSSGNYFGDVFRSVYKVSPREYRKGASES